MKQINWFVGQWRFVFNKIDASVQCNVSLLILVADLTSFLGLKYVHGVSADLSCTPYERVWMCMRAFKCAYMSASESQVGQSVAHSSYVTGILPQLSQHLSWSIILSDLSSRQCIGIWLSYPALASGHFDHAGIDWLDRKAASDTSKERPWCWGLKLYFSLMSYPHIVDVEVEGGVDFSQAKRDPESGKLCVLEEKEVDTLLKKPILECTHRSENRSMNILFEYVACG